MSVSVNHHREGSGQPLVLLHGIGHRWQDWTPVIDRLSGEFEVIACDSPGFGRSPQLPTGIEPTIFAYVDAFEWFFIELGLERPHVAGHSMGGAIALELARRRAVRSATALSPVGFWTSAERRYFQLCLGAMARMPAGARPLVRALARTHVGRVALFSHLYRYPERLTAAQALSALQETWEAPAFTGVLAACGEYRLRDPEKLRRVAVAVAWGERDRVLLYSRQAPRARAMLPWATHASIDAGHTPLADDPAAVAAVIRACASSDQASRSTAH